MAEFRITGPDGAKYKVNAPDEAAAEAAVLTMFGAPRSGGQGFAGAQQVPQAPPVPPGGEVPSAATQPVVPPPRSWMQAIDDTGAQAMIGVRRSVSTLAGLPVDAVNNIPRVLNLLPGVSGVPRMSGDRAPVGGSDFIDAILASPTRAIQAATGQEMKDPEPVDTAGRFARRVGEEIGGAVLPAGAVLRTAKVGAELSPLAKLFGADKARVSPTRYVRDEAAAATAAGLGAASAGETVRAMGVQPDGPGQNLAELGGSIGGVGALSVGKSLAGAAGNILGAVTGSTRFADKVVRQDAADALINSSTTLSRNGGPIDTTGMANTLATPDAEITNVIPGFQPSTADRLGDAGMAALEYNRASQAPGAFNQRRAENAAAVDTAFGNLAPSGSAAAARDAMIAERDARRAAVDERAAFAQDDAASSAAALAATTSPEQRGQMIRAAVEDAAAAAISGDRAAADRALRAADDALAALAPSLDAQTRGEMLRGEIAAAEQRATTARREAYSAANVDKKPVPAAGLTERLDNTLAGMTETERSLVPQGLLDRVSALGRPKQDGPIDTGLLDETGAPIMRDAPMPPPVPLKEATDLISQLGHLRRAALADPRAANGGDNAARVINQLADQVMAFVRGVLTPDEVARLDAARAASFGERETFSRQGDAMARSLAEYRGGRSQVPSQAVPDLFVAPGADEQLVRLLGAADTPATRRALEDHILAQLARAGSDEGKIRAFLDAYARPLEQFPGLRDRIAAAADARGAAMAAEQAVAARQTDFIGGSRGLDDTLRTRPSGAPSVPDAGVAGRFASSDAEIGSLLRAADTPDVRTALRDELVSRIGSLDNPQRARAALDAYGPQLDRFPGLRQQVEQAIEAGATARLSAQNQEQFVRSMGGVLPSGAEVRGTSTVAKWINYGEENAARAMQHVASQQDPARAVDDLMRFVGNDANAVEGLRRAFWDLMEGRAKTQTVMNPSGGGTSQAWSPVNLRKFLENPGVRAVAERLYRDNPEHLQNLDQIAAVLQRVDMRTTARAPNTSGTAQTSIPVETIQSRLYAVNRGVVGAPYAVTSVIAMYARGAVSAMQKKALGQVLDRALIDPEYAAVLLRENNPANRAALAKSTRAWMGPAAGDIIEALDASADPDAEMKRAITQEK
jgi:hypothetical protein